MKPLYISIAVAVFMTSMVFGMVIFTCWVLPYFFADASLKAQQINRLLGTASALDYGTVVNIDSEHNSITADVVNQFAPDKRIRLSYTVVPAAYIARQELQRDSEGVIDSLSARSVSPLSAIRPGDRIEILANREADGGLSTGYILFGNPL